jgi:DNA invertase Pin-like site-specific DNA recombinase
MADRNRKGRTARGEQTSHHQPRAKGSRNGNSKLGEADITVIRSRRQSGEMYKTIARDYGVTIGTIWKVTAGYSWTHAAAPSTTSNQ